MIRRKVKIPNELDGASMDNLNLSSNHIYKHKVSIISIVAFILSFYPIFSIILRIISTKVPKVISWGIIFSLITSFLLSIIDICIGNREKALSIAALVISSVFIILYISLIIVLLLVKQIIANA